MAHHTGGQAVSKMDDTGELKVHHHIPGHTRHFRFATYTIQLAPYRASFAVSSDGMRQYTASRTKKKGIITLSLSRELRDQPRYIKNSPVISGCRTTWNG